VATGVTKTSDIAREVDNLKSKIASGGAFTTAKSDLYRSFNNASTNQQIKNSIRNVTNLGSADLQELDRILVDFNDKDIKRLAQQIISTSQQFK
jgi:uncharacterized protein YcbK (DUF882 family)